MLPTPQSDNLLEALPPEIVMHILSFLRLPDLGRFAQTSQAARQLANDAFIPAPTLSACLRVQHISNGDIMPNDQNAIKYKNLVKLNQLTQPGIEALRQRVKRRENFHGFVHRGNTITAATMAAVGTAILWYLPELNHQLATMGRGIEEFNQHAREIGTRIFHFRHAPFDEIQALFRHLDQNNNENKRAHSDMYSISKQYDWLETIMVAMSLLAISFVLLNLLSKYLGKGTEREARFTESRFSLFGRRQATTIEAANQLGVSVENTSEQELLSNLERVQQFIPLRRRG